MVNILLVDDHRVLLDGLNIMLSTYDFIDIVGLVQNGEDAINFCEEHEVDLVVMDLVMPGQWDGGQAASIIKSKNPKIKILALSMLGDKSSVDYMISSGADGFMIKNSSGDELSEAIKKIMQGAFYIYPSIFNNLKSYLSTLPLPHSLLNITAMEKTVLQFIAQGKTTQEIAGIIYRSEETVKSHRKKLLNKLKCKNSAELIMVAYKQKLL